MCGRCAVLVDGNTGQLVNGLSGMCRPHPGACQCGVRCSAGNVGPGCLGNPGCASRPVVTFDGHFADSGGVLPESIRVSGSNMPHPMGSARAGDSLDDRGFEVTASTQSGTPIHALHVDRWWSCELWRSSASFPVRTLCQLAAGHSA